MRILWFSPFLLHPTLQGGQIRSLGILRELHARHEVRFVSLVLPGQEDGARRVSEFSSTHRLIPHRFPAKRSPGFALQSILNLAGSLPLTVVRDNSPAFQAAISEELAAQWHDVAVCDFLGTSINFPRMDDTVLFQHNVETLIWRRQAEHAEGKLWSGYLRSQARRMFEFERRKCLDALRVIAVSDADGRFFEENFGITNVSTIPTGVDLEYFAPPADPVPGSEIVFVGSLNWQPNIEGLQWFCREVWLDVLRDMPGCRLAVVGRNPTPAVLRLQDLAGVTVHGSVPDVRPFFWGAKLAVVPLFAGSGTRIKIYEAMAAGTPQVSTHLGAEGLTASDGENIIFADDARTFREGCLRLLRDQDFRTTIRNSGLTLVREHFGHERVGRAFEEILRSAAPIALP